MIRGVSGGCCGPVAGFDDMQVEILAALQNLIRNVDKSLSHINLDSLKQEYKSDIQNKIRSSCFKRNIKNKATLRMRNNHNKNHMVIQTGTLDKIKTYFDNFPVVIKG